MIVCSNIALSDLEVIKLSATELAIYIYIITF